MTIIAATKYLEFKSAKSPSNNDWYYIRRTNDTNKHDSAVVITTLVRKESINKEGLNKPSSYQILLLKTKRPPIYAENKALFSIESPAGLIGDTNCKESLLDCTRKELEEETGYCNSKIYQELNNCSTSNGLSSETLSFATAIVNKKDLKKTPVDDGGIIVDRFYIDFDTIDDYIKNLNTKTYSIATATIAGIYLAKTRISGL